MEKEEEIKRLQERDNLLKLLELTNPELLNSLKKEVLKASMNQTSIGAEGNQKPPVPFNKDSRRKALEEEEEISEGGNWNDSGDQESIGVSEIKKRPDQHSDEESEIIIGEPQRKGEVRRSSRGGPSSRGGHLGQSSRGSESFTGRGHGRQGSRGGGPIRGTYIPEEASRYQPEVANRRGGMEDNPRGRGYGKDRGNGRSSESWNKEADDREFDMRWEEPVSFKNRSNSRSSGRGANAGNSRDQYHQSNRQWTNYQNRNSYQNYNSKDSGYNNWGRDGNYYGNNATPMKPQQDTYSRESGQQGTGLYERRRQLGEAPHDARRHPAIHDNMNLKANSFKSLAKEFKNVPIEEDQRPLVNFKPESTKE